MKRILMICIFFGTSCTIAPHISVNTTLTSDIAVSGKLFATIFQQRASEYRALCYQAYNVARWRVDMATQSKGIKPFAIMTDVDETVLSNAAYQAHQTLQGKDYEPDSWYQWTAMAKADTVPGALDFLQYASSKGVRIFYVTNRDERERAGTLKNLRNFNFPDADNEHLLLRATVSSKEARKQQVLDNHELILLIGDNLNDLNKAFENRYPGDRMKATDSLSGQFGKNLIVLPNAVYGDWENSLYHYDRSLTPAQKDSVLKAALYSY